MGKSQQLHIVPEQLTAWLWQMWEDNYGYLIPNLTYKSGEQMEPLYSVRFVVNVVNLWSKNDEKWRVLIKWTQAAREREEVILKQLEEKEPLPDKEKNQIAWVRAANQHRAIAEEIILKELIYV